MLNIISLTNNAMELIEETARTCTDTETKNSEKFIEGLLKRKHMTPFEFADCIFELEDVSRVLTHQLVRFRMAVFQQRSGRYTANNKFVIPSVIQNDNANKMKFIEHCMDSMKLYNQFLKNGILKEDARYLLPEALCSDIRCKMNFRELLHAIDLRVSLHAQEEIRLVFMKLWKVLYQSYPNIFNLIYFENESVDLEYKKTVFEKYIKGDEPIKELEIYTHR